MTRKAVTAGMFYADSFDALDKQIAGCFTAKFGPGELPIERKDKKIMGIIVPHAAYQFSGPGQAWCYKEIAESEFADTYIILGTSHTKFKQAATLIDEFETPFGMVHVDERFTKSLIDKGVVTEDKIAHQNEHSIEVQLPFLQFVNKDRLDKIRIVPIVVGKETNYEKLGKAIASTVLQMERKVILICSSDFTHYGISYSYLPFRGDVKTKLKEFDLAAIRWITDMDSWSFLNYVEETGATICGAYAIATFLEACKGLGAQKGRVEQYYTSGEVTEDYANVVGYGSIIVE